LECSTAGRPRSVGKGEGQGKGHGGKEAVRTNGWLQQSTDTNKRTTNIQRRGAGALRPQPKPYPWHLPWHPPTTGGQWARRLRCKQSSTSTTALHTSGHPMLHNVRPPTRHPSILKRLRILGGAKGSKPVTGCHHVEPLQSASTQLSCGKIVPKGLGENTFARGRGHASLFPAPALPKGRSCEPTFMSPNIDTPHPPNRMQESPSAMSSPARVCAQDPR
jgi:hypothetical protein